MRHRKAIRLAAVCTAMAIAGMMLWSKSSPKDPVRVHLDAIRSLETSWAGPSTFRDYFRHQTWRWFFRGRPVPQVSFDAIEEHKRALLELGYFERRAFPLHHRILDSAGRAQFNSLLRTNVSFSDNHWTMSTTGAQPSVVFIVARPDDMPLWSNIVQQFDRSDTP